MFGSVLNIAYFCSHEADFKTYWHIYFHAVS